LEVGELKTVRRSISWTGEGAGWVLRAGPEGLEIRTGRGEAEETADLTALGAWERVRTPPAGLGPLLFTMLWRGQWSEKRPKGKINGEKRRAAKEGKGAVRWTRERREGEKGREREGEKKQKEDGEKERKRRRRMARRREKEEGGWREGEKKQKEARSISALLKLFQLPAARARWDTVEWQAASANGKAGAREIVI
jgi:hypothetical protein